MFDSESGAPIKHYAVSPYISLQRHIQDIIKPWTDYWIGKYEGIIDMGVVVPHDLLNFKLKILADKEGRWNWELMRLWLPDWIVPKIKSILPPSFVGCHCLWWWCKNDLHDDNFMRPYYQSNFVQDRIEEYDKSQLTGNVVSQGETVRTQVVWEALDAGWVKLNTNGTSKDSGGAGCGGIIHNIKG